MVNRRNNMKKEKTILSTVVLVMMLASCATERHSSFFRGDVIGFSDNVTTSYSTQSRGLFMNMQDQSKPFDLLTASGVVNMKDAINRVPRGNNTTAYYAMELAAKRVKYVRKKIAKNDPNTRYYIFMLTDGLDNASSQVAKNDGRILFSISPEKYQKRIQRKLKQAMGCWNKNEFEVYTLMYEGDDIEEAKRMNNMTDEQYKTILQKSMSCFRYSSQGTAPELISANSFQAITEKVKERLKNTTYTFKVPKSYAGKRIRMNFKNRRGETEVTLTATLKKTLLSYSLTDIRFSNGASANVTAYQAYKDPQSPNAYFVINDFRLNGSAYIPQDREITQDYEYQTGVWQRNSEYTEATREIINTYFILVIDGSKSLDGKNHDKNGFEEETAMAKEIMQIMSSSK